MHIADKNSITAAAADKLIAAHDGDIALLYVWLCRNGSFNAEKAAAELCRNLSQINSAYEKLCRMGLPASAAPTKSAEKVMPAEELPEYTAKDIVTRSKTDSGFKAVLDEAQRKLGRTLSSSDMKTLFGIYDYLALPPDVIFMLLAHCIDVFADKYGPGRLPSMRSIEKEAYSWANKEIMTLEQADEYIRSYQARRGRLNELKAALGITGRQPTATETKYMLSWLEMGFDTECLSIAYDRTVTNTGSLKWNYMNKIVTSWHEKGLHTPADIEEKDGRSPAAKKPDNEHRSTAQSNELGRLRSIYEKVKNG